MKDEISIFIDFETTGLIPKNPIKRIFKRNLPRIVQMAWLIYKNEKLIEEKEYIIKPTNFKIPYHSTKIHGIDMEKALNEGVDANYALKTLLKKIESSHLIIGHNIRFDLNILKFDCNRHNLTINLDSKKIICTMLDNKLFMRPSNSFLYEQLFGTKLINAHNAIFDIKATSKSFFQLKKQKKI